VRLSALWNDEDIEGAIHLGPRRAIQVGF